MKSASFLTHSIFCSILLFNVYIPSTQAAQGTCLAVPMKSVSYLSKLHYSVFCEDELFDTNPVWSRFMVFPRFNYEALAQDKLMSTMTEKGYQVINSVVTPVSDISEFNTYMDDVFVTLFVFEKAGTKRLQYRLALLSEAIDEKNHKSVQPRFQNVSVLKGKPDYTREYYSDLTEHEVIQAMADDGFSLTLDSQPALGQLNGKRSPVGDSIGSGHLKFILFKKN